MKSIIRELYNGNLSPADKTLSSNPKLKKKMDAAGEIEDKLASLLDGENKKLFEELCEIQTDITIMNGEERYIDGFKMGMRIAVESLSDKDLNNRKV
jgi:hypothetical protein